MKVYSEISVKEFDAWSGAVDTLATVIDEDKCEALDFILEELYPDGMSDEELNDLLWFDRDEVFKWLGIKDPLDGDDEEDDCEDDEEDLEEPEDDE